MNDLLRPRNFCLEKIQFKMNIKDQFFKHKMEGSCIKFERLIMINKSLKQKKAIPSKLKIFGVFE